MLRAVKWASGSKYHSQRYPLRCKRLQRCLGAGALDRTLPLSSPEPATPHRGQPVPSPVKRPARHQCALGVSLDAPVGAHATLAVAERDHKYIHENLPTPNP
ncbi:hypothetical protein NPIL_342841 [Nephila pilipes]|uniref:Uncharacterized protein n=1 Tax=Nephila pilipes TaxID=299642 RepID=A0A8X6TQR0_NEPPI|nr:hypothetical protein NPIL_342841 [Nephila pilipes]